jgi:aspartyl-tRNA(Asn)/glutamyl-tRNA(Gln) amidotransferase subunit A
MKGETNAIVSAGVAGLNALYRTRAVTPEEAAAAHLDRIQRLNPGLNAFVHIDEEGVREAAAQSSERWRASTPLSVLDGVPFAVKANVAVRNHPWTAALVGLRNRVATEDAAIVERLRALGAIPIGIANMHEGALGATTESPLYGRAQNPLKPGFTPGGSSGGSAAAVAAGLAPLAVGTDTMGSVRIPSAYCGVVGFKPTRGRLPTKGLERLSWSLDHIGFHARTAADIAVALGAMEGKAPETDTPHPDALKVAIFDPASAVAWEPPVSEAFAAALDRLRAGGFRIDICAVSGLDLARLRRRALLVCEAEAGVWWRSVLETGSDAVSSGLRALLDFGAGEPASRLAEAYAEMETARDAMVEAFARFDVLLSPTAPHRAFAWEAAVPREQADLTVLANVLGAPAVTTACGDPAWPSGLQMMTAPGRDLAALAFAQAFEALG